MSTRHYASSSRSWATPHELIDHIVTTYHDHTRMALPELGEVLERVTEDRVLAAGPRERLISELTALADQLETHLEEQEGWLFPIIRHMDEAADESEWACELAESLEWLMDRAAHENGQTLTQLNRVQRCLRGAAIGDQQLATDLIEQVQLVGKNLREHTQLETDVLFPWVKELLTAEGLVTSGLYW